MLISQKCWLLLQIRLHPWLCPLSSAACSIMHNLGLIFDGFSSFDTHVKQLAKSWFFNLWNISQLRSVVSTGELEMLIRAFISSRINYCNTLSFSFSMSSLDRLQAIQNAAARLLARSNRGSHITPVLGSLPWLLVVYRIKLSLLLSEHSHSQVKYAQFTVHPTHPPKAPRWSGFWGRSI